MAWSERLDFSGQTLSLWSARLDFAGETLGPGTVTLVAPLAEAGQRITAIPDLAGGDILEWHNVVGGTDSDVIVYTNGTFECSRAVTAFDVRADDGIELSAFVTQTVGPPVVNAASFQMRANTDGVGVPREVWSQHFLVADGFVTDAPEIGVPVIGNPAIPLVANGVSTGAPVLGTPVAGEAVVGDNATQFNAILNGRVAPFAYEVAADPVITDTVEVTPATIGQNNNLTTNGRRLILTAGTYAAFEVNGSDRELVFQAGVTTGRIDIGNSSRLRLIGSPERAHTINNIVTRFQRTMTDVSFIGLNIVSADGVGTTATNENALNDFDRVLIMRCYIDMVWHSLYMSAAGTHNNMILAKCSVFQNREATGAGQTQAGPRGTGMQRWLNVDCRFRNENAFGGASRQCWRTHSTFAATQYVWATGCEFVGTAIQMQPQDGTSSLSPMSDLWFDGNDFYPNVVDGVTVNIITNGNLTTNPYPTDVRWLNNRIFTDAGSSFSIPSGVGWTTSNNQQLPAEALPAWSWT